MKAIINGKIILEDKIIKDKVLVFDNEIEGIESCVSDSFEIIDAEDNYVSPGFIDMHIHGIKGNGFTLEYRETIHKTGESLPEFGVTGFLPTLVSEPRNDMLEILKLIKGEVKKATGASILGVHLEGPFISSLYRGAHDEKNLYYPDTGDILCHKDIIKMITYAPELDENNQFLKTIKGNSDIIMAMGHTNATFEEAQKAIYEGASHCTHIFNAMRHFDHREPGIIGAALLQPVSVDIVADMIHVNKELFQLLLNNKGKESIALITDAIFAAGLEEGVYHYQGRDFYVKDGTIRLGDGKLAGSILTLNRAADNFYKHTSLSVAETVGLISKNPARILGIDDKKGSLQKGLDADIVIFNDSFEIQRTIIEGNTVFCRQRA
ncbi:N-acetylglucosamine-6-phosphate deacetylase [Anaerocolumna xylanovorans]|nr:N-acetylglucosamine-6-phosphate deacetylase [Anaerocolumna xylanovorans]